MVAVERIENLKVAGESSDGWDGAPVGEIARVGMFGAVEDLAGGIDLDHPGLTERTAGDILREFLDAVGVTGIYAYVLVNAEPAMPPCAHGLDDVFVNPSFIQGELEHAMFPNLEEWLRRQRGHGAVRPIGGEGAVSDERVDMRMPENQRVLPCVRQSHQNLQLRGLFDLPDCRK